jgi:recombining binding protein (suppressor of hairless)
MNSPDPPPSSRPDASRWEFNEILKSSNVSRDRLMSVDPAPSSLPPHNTSSANFLPPHFDQPMDSHPPHSAGHLPIHPFDNDKMDVTEHPPYDLFPPPPQLPFPHQRIRSNTSPAAVPSYGHNSEPNYSGMFPHDSVQSFHSQTTSPYDMMSSISSSLSSGKATPLTPSDPIGALPFTSAPPNGIKQDFTELIPDRRLSVVSSNNFQSDLPDDYQQLAVNSHPAFGSTPTPLPPFSDRLTRYHQDTFLGQSQMQGHPHDQLRGVPPQATHSRFEGVPSYDEIPNYLMQNPPTDLSLRIPGVGDAMMGMRIGQMGAATDLQTFIR